ncbi:MAG TPA: CpaD family pilus assembly lipoprotein [Stellaceae bacterium]|nr:CpaD family pilus assembly lipoprotein [Stellaceae bacterium]
MSDPPVRARIGPVLWAFVGVGLLATCAEPVYQDYTQRFPLGTQPETVSVPARFVGTADPFAGSAAESFNTLVEGYLDRGHGPITIAARAPAARGNSAAPARMEALRQRLVAAGVPASMIHLQLASEGQPDTVTLSYERYTAVLPTCGDWSTRMDFNPLNTDYAGFGCAQQRNLGVMVADPADLATMRRPAPSDTANTERVIREYRGVGLGLGGQPVATESNKNSLQSAGDQNAASGSTVGTGATGATSAR